MFRDSVLMVVYFVNKLFLSDHYPCKPRFDIISIRPQKFLNGVTSTHGNHEEGVKLVAGI